MEKKLLVVLVVVGLCSTVALAFDPMGPPAAGLGKGKTSLGIEYIWNKMEFERNTLSDSTAEKTPKLDPLHKVYGVFGYGVADNVDVFARAGAACADWDLPAAYDWEMGGSWSFVYGCGVRMTLAENPGVKWGVLAQYSWNQLRGEGDEPGGEKTNWDMTLDEMTIAFGPTWAPSQGLSIYGGPFLHFIRGYEELDMWGDIHRHPMSDENWFGGYIGAQLEVCQNCALNVEWIQTADDMAGAVGLVWKQ